MNVTVVDHTHTDLSVAEKSSKFRKNYMVGNYIQSLMLVYTSISRYSGSPCLHFSGIYEKCCKLQEIQKS
jgi:hypothetical protein